MPGWRNQRRDESGSSERSRTYNPRVGDRRPSAEAGRLRQQLHAKDAKGQFDPQEVAQPPFQGLRPFEVTEREQPGQVPFRWSRATRIPRPYADSEVIRHDFGAGHSNVMIPILRNPPSDIRYLPYGPESLGPSQVNRGGIYVSVNETRMTSFGAVHTPTVCRVVDIQINDPRLRNGFYCLPQWGLYNPSEATDDRPPTLSSAPATEPSTEMLPPAE